MNIIRRIVLCLVVMLLAVKTACAQNIQVIVNSSVQVKELSINDLRDIFTMKQVYWKDGQKVKVFVLPKDSLLARRFIAEVLQLPPSMYFDLLEGAYSTGRTNLPTVIVRQETLIVKVMITPGGIGYTDIPAGKLNEDEIHVLGVGP